ncbi:hypothetical protein B6V72_18375 [Thioclava sp. F34-6]|nr:hypothetical protein B6V72_18375 [Thioclava sp. F34-6]
MPQTSAIRRDTCSSRVMRISGNLGRRVLQRFSQPTGVITVNAEQPFDVWQEAEQRLFRYGGPVGMHEIEKSFELP